MNTDGEWMIGSQVPLRSRRGTTKLVRLVSSAIQECLAYDKTLKSESLPLLLCIAEKERPGRLEDLDDLLTLVQDQLGLKFHPHSECIAQGKVGGAVALQQRVSFSTNKA